MRVARYIVPVVLAVGMAACGAAAASEAPTRSAPKPHVPTAAEVQHWDEAVLAGTVWTNTVAANAWYDAAFWADVQALADNYVPPVVDRGFHGTPAAPHVSAGAAVGGACGGATNGSDAYIGRESGGNPNARNPSGAWGCYQIMPGTWASSCSDLGQHGSASTQAQAACASRLPSSAWAASEPKH